MEGFGGLQAGATAQNYALDQSVNRAGMARRRADQEGSVEHAAKELEIVFATMMVKEMRKTLGDGLFGSGPGVDTFEGWFDDHVGRSIASSGVMDLVGLLKASGGPQSGEAGTGENS